MDLLAKSDQEIFAIAKPFWEKRAAHIIDWCLSHETLETPRTHHTEISGHLPLFIGGQTFHIIGRSDRIDVSAEGLTIIDYKTGAIPSTKEVEAGFAPQLPLEALIAMEGGFTNLPKAGVEVLNYWRLSGSIPPGQVVNVAKESTQLAEDAKAGLLALIQAFDQGDTPYEARPRPDQAPRFSEYEHLARLKEWAVAGENSGDLEI
mgnify:CR=1 FL=1